MVIDFVLTSKYRTVFFPAFQKETSKEIGLVMLHYVCSKSVCSVTSENKVNKLPCVADGQLCVRSLPAEMEITVGQPLKNRTKRCFRGHLAFS
jgi:hypothetical protein